MTELDYTQEMYRKPSSKIEGYLNGSAAGNWGLACVITRITLDKCWFVFAVASRSSF